MMTEKHEKENASSWTFEQNSTYFTQLNKGIVGFEIGITDMKARFKYHQKSDHQDRNGAIQGLQSKGDDMSLAVTDWMEKLNP